MREVNLERFQNYKQTSKSDYYFLVYKRLISSLEKAVSAYAKKRVLDIGCGNKPYEAMFDGKISEYIGCDIVQSSLNKVDIICEANKIPLDDAGFETVFSTQTIEHVADHQVLLNEAFRLLKPGGHLIISGPMYWHLHEEPHDYFRFTKFGFQYILEKSGFTIVEIYSNGGKWSTLGQVFLHTLPKRLTNFKFLRNVHNRFFSWLDEKYYNDFNTMNYVIVGRKGKK